MNRFIAVAAAAVLAAGCADRGITDVSSQQSDPPNAALAAPIGDLGPTVMTWNVYYGTDPSPLLTVQDPNDIPVVAAGIWALAQQTNFPERAGAIAKAIAANRPDLVGLQEAALYRIQHPAGAPEQVEYDFLKLLLDSLAKRGQHYFVAAADSTTDIAVPVLTGFDQSGPTFDVVRLTDRDAILARSDVRITSPRHAKYDTYVPISIGGVETGIYEGWSSVLASVRGQTYRFVSTHLEAQPFMPVPVGQAQELIDLLQHENRPTILVGDFNSDVYGADPSKATPSYGMITAAGFTDAWLRPFGTPPGLTCCQSDDLLNASSTFDQRVDFIFTRNMPQQGHASTFVLRRNVVGDEESDRTIPSGLWPSDHGGVVATFVTSSFGPLVANAVK